MANDSLPQVKARLASKNDRKVMCGRMLPSGELCDGRIGYIAITELHPTQWAKIHGRRLVAGEQYEIQARELVLPLGWAQDDNGIWHRSAYAERRLEHRQKAKYRKTQVQYILEGGQQLRFNYWPTPTLPSRVRCPNCQCEQMLDSSILNVVNIPRMHSGG